MPCVLGLDSLVGAAVREGRRSWEVKVIKGGDGNGPPIVTGGTVVGLSSSPQNHHKGSEDYVPSVIAKCFIFIQVYMNVSLTE